MIFFVTCARTRTRWCVCSIKWICLNCIFEVNESHEIDTHTQTHTKLWPNLASALHSSIIIIQGSVRFWLVYRNIIPHVGCCTCVMCLFSIQSNMICSISQWQLICFTPQNVFQAILWYFLFYLFLCWNTRCSLFIPSNDALSRWRSTCSFPSHYNSCFYWFHYNFLFPLSKEEFVCSRMQQNLVSTIQEKLFWNYFCYHYHLCRKWLLCKYYLLSSLMPLYCHYIYAETRAIIVSLIRKKQRMIRLK